MVMIMEEDLKLAMEPLLITDPPAQTKLLLKRGMFPSPLTKLTTSQKASITALINSLHTAEIKTNLNQSPKISLSNLKLKSQTHSTGAKKKAKKSQPQDLTLTLAVRSQRFKIKLVI